MTLGEAVEGREEEFPLLSRALADASRAGNPMIEWVADTISGTDFNYTQIFRTFSHAGDHDGTPQMDDGPSVVALGEMLRVVETALTHGVRSREPRAMSGALDSLGRLPEDGDEFSLRILRDLRYVVVDTDHLGVPRDYPFAEWLCEVSLQAQAGSRVALARGA